LRFVSKFGFRYSGFRNASFASRCVRPADPDRPPLSESAAVERRRLPADLLGPRIQLLRIQIFANRYLTERSFRLRAGCVRSRPHKQCPRPAAGLSSVCVEISTVRSETIRSISRADGSAALAPPRPSASRHCSRIRKIGRKIVIDPFFQFQPDLFGHAPPETSSVSNQITHLESGPSKTHAGRLGPYRAVAEGFSGILHKPLPSIQFSGETPSTRT